MTQCAPRPLPERLLEQALDEARSGLDAIPTASAALAALRAEVGEATPAELADLTELADPARRACTCPPDLLRRGGFRGGCPAHDDGI